ncbi:MAG: glycosyltransferase family 4 protein [Halobacteriota archaeon]|nr:glycosyltransferase family 4 protein [Halobacteriota archaeon]
MNEYDYERSHERGSIKMKILHFVHCYLPIYGGTTTRLCNLLSNEINQHYLYISQVQSENIPDNVGALSEEEDFGNIKVRRCKLVREFKVKIPFINTFRYIKINSDRLMNFVKEEDFDIVHGHNPIEFATASTKYAKKKNIPFVYEVHGLTTDTPILKKKRYIPELAYSSTRLFLRLNEKEIFKNADAIITQTNAMKQRITDLFDIDLDKIKIAPNGVDESKFDPINWHQKGEKLRREKKWVDKTVFMYSGFLDDINGIHFFLDTIKELPDDIKGDIKVVILGRGPLQEYVKDMSKENSNLIEYLGLVNYDDMPEYYSACDVFVIPRPSTLPAECLIPMKLLEAMAMEKILLGSDVGGITEVVTNNKNGIIFRKDSKDDLLKKISYIAEKIESLDEIRNRARKDVITRYNWEKSREMLQNVYESVI